MADFDWSTAFDPTTGAKTGGGIGAELSSGIHAANAQLNAIPAAFGSQAGMTNMIDEQRMAQNAAERAGAAGIPQSVSDVHGPVDLLKFAGGQAVSAAPQLGAVALGGIAAGPMGAGVAAAPLAMGSNLQAQYNQSGKFDIPSAAALAVPEAAMNAVAPEARLFQKGASGVIAAETGSRLGNIAARGLATGASQGVVGAGLAELNEVAKKSVDPNYDLASSDSLSQVGAGAVSGAVAGGLIGAVHGAFHTPVDIAASREPELSTSPDAQPSDPYNLLQSPTFMRRGGQTDERGMPVANPSGQGDLFSGRVQSGDTSNLRPTEAEAANAGPSTQDAIDGLKQMHSDVSDALRQHQLAEQYEPGQHGEQIAALQDQQTRIAQHLDILNGALADEQAAQQPLFQKPDDPLIRMGTGLDTPAPATPNPDAQIAPANPLPAPNPDAKLVVPPRPTVGDQLIAAQKVRAAGLMPTADQAALLRRPPEPANPNAQVVVPPEKGGFQLTPDRRTFGDTQPRPPLELTPPEGNAAQHELDLGHHEPTLSPPPPDAHTADMFANAYGSSADWKARMRVAWMDQSDGSKQGFHKALAKALSAEHPDEAAAIIRDKADDPATNTAYRKLDAVHKALTGESIEEHLTREASTPVHDVVEGESHSAAEGADTAARPVEGAPVEKAAAEEGAKPKVTQDERRAADHATTDSILSRLDTIKKPEEFQRAADELYAHSQNGQTYEGRTRAYEELQNPKNGFTDHNILQAEQNHDNAEMAKVIRFSESKRSEGATATPTTSDSGVVHGTPRSGADVVAQLARTASDPAVRQAMQHVMKNSDLSNVRVSRVGEGDEIHPVIAHALGDGANGAIARYPDGRMEIHLAHDAGEEAVAHELVHAATLAALDDPAKAAPFKALMDEVRNRLAGSANPDAALFEKHALGDVKEFVAYAATNPRLRDLMASLDQPGKRTLWDSFKAAVQKALGIPKLFLDKLLGKEPKGVIHSGALARFDAAFRDHLESTPKDEAAHAAEVKFHAYAADPKAMAAGLKGAGETIWSSIKGTASRMMLGAMPTHAIVDSFQHQLRSLPDVLHAIEDRTVRQHELARGAAKVHDDLVSAFRDQKSLDRLHSVFEDAQTAMIDPRTEPMDRVQSYLKVAQEKLSRLPQGATTLERMRAEDHLKRAAAGARLKDNWSKMSDAEKKAFGSAVETMQASMAARQNAANEILLRSRDAFKDPVLEQMRAEGASEQAIDQHIIDTYGKEFKTIDGAYAPLKRFGEWVVARTSPEYRAAEKELRDARIASAGERANGKVSDAATTRLQNAQDLMQLMQRDGAHREVTFHESSAEAQKAKAAALAAHPDHEVQRFTRGEYGQQVTAANGATIGRIMEAVGHELPPELKKNVEAIIRDMYVDSLPDGSFAQTQQMRAGVAGYSTDFSRSILDSLLRDSFQISTLEHSEKIGQSMKALDAERRKLGTDNANNIHDTLAARIDVSTQFKKVAQFEQRMSEVTHAMYLGASPGFLLMNMMQMPMITVPMLHARFGMGKVEGPLAKAVGDVWKSIQKSRLEVDSSAHLTDEEKQVLTRLQNLGILNMTQMHDTAQAARSSNIIDPKTAGEHAAKGWDQTKDLLNLPAQYVETVNRAASALAAYRLAREGSAKFGKMDHGAAMDYAAKIVRDSHVDYSAVNNPAWLKTGFMPGSRLLFQFKKYWLNMLSMVSTNMWDAFGHHDDVKQLRNALADDAGNAEKVAEHQAMLNHLLERRAVARRTLAGLYGMHMIHTGALGMPFVGAGITLSNIMRNWYNDPEDRADTETDLRNYIAEAFGTQASDTLFHGIWSGMFGMGISQRIGMGDLASPVKVFNADKLSGKDYGKELLIGLMGPTVSKALDWVDAAHQYEAGNYERGTEKLLPKVASDILKATRREMDGGEVSPSGKMVAQTTEGDAIKQALGIAPERVNDAYAAKNAVAVAKTQFDSTRNSLLKDAATASKLGDADARQQAMEAIQSFNARNPAQGQKITMGDVLRATHAMTAAPKPPKPGQARFNAEGDFAKDE